MSISSSILADTGAAQADQPEPAPVIGLAGTVEPTTLLLMCLALSVIALVAVCNVMRVRRASRTAARQARSQSDAMRELLRTVRMAESMAGIGVWQYDYVTEIQQWSDGLKRLFGIERDEPMCAGDAETVLFASDVDLVGKIRQHSDAVEPFTLQLDIDRFDGVPCRVALQACNLRNNDGAVQRVVAVVRDVTEEMVPGADVVREWGEAPEHSPRSLRLRKGVRSNLPLEVDELTCLPNRCRLMRELDQLVMDARLSHRPLVLVMFDIDHFKRYNDLYGRGEGDLVLQEIARLTDEQAREHDVIARVGGEEFGWIIPNATEGMARVMTERLRQSIARGSGVVAVAPVTISIGFAAMQVGDTSLSLFGRADQALYEAKHSGRNRVRVAA